MSENPQYQLSFTPGGSEGSGAGDTGGSGLEEAFPAVLDIAELQQLINTDNAFRDMDWQRPARGWPGAATDLTFPLFTKDMPPPELNRLYYPSSGATKWGYVYMAFTGAQIEEIKHNPTGTITLQTNNGIPSEGAASDRLDFKNFTLLGSVPLWELAKSPDSGRVTAVSDDTTTLHLCLFCDERFWFANYSDSTAAGVVGASWVSLITDLLTTLDINNPPPASGTLTVPTLSGDYGFPSQFSDWIDSFQYNSAVMLDAALLNVGLMLIRNIDGTYALSNFIQSAELESNTTYNGHFLRAGGGWKRAAVTPDLADSYLGSLPASVTFYFPMWDEAGVTNVTMWGPAPPGVYPPAGPSWLYQWNNDEGMFHVRSPLNTTYYYPVNVTINQAFGNFQAIPPRTPGLGTKLFRESARACSTPSTDESTSSHAGNPPTNIDAMKRLALQVASDYYLSKLYSLRQETWNGFIPPSGSGWFTYIY